MKPVEAILFIVLLVGSLVTSLQFVGFAQANFFPDPGPDLARIYIRTDGSVEPSTAPIEKAGTLYKLTDNIILFTIEIQTDNIILDGSDYLIQGNETWMGTAPHHGDAGNNAIIITERNNITIRNVNFQKCTTGVRIYNSTNIRIIENIFNNETAGLGNALGVAIKDSSLVLIEKNYFTSFSGSAIACNGTDNIIKENIITDIAASMYGNVDIEGSSNLISDNIIRGMLPITLDRADSNIIARNIISGPAPTPYIVDENRTGTEGIALFGRCSNNIILGNNITGFHGQAIRTVFTCSNNTIYGNYMANNGFAVVLQYGAINNTFFGNTFAVDSCKIGIDDGVEGTLWDNGTTGNHWADYNGTDSNRDGIGDIPYIINAYRWDSKAEGFVSYVSGQDNYPLMYYNYPDYNSPEPSPSIDELTLVPIPILLAISTIFFFIMREKRKRN